MTRAGDVLYFLRQIFFPNWTDREDGGNPTELQKLLAAILLHLTSRNGTGVLFSLVLHAFILAILALWMIPKMSGFAGVDILGSLNVPGVEQSVNIGSANGTADDNGTQQNVASTEATAVSDTTDQLVSETETDPDTESLAVTPGAEDWQTAARGGFGMGGGYGNRNPGGRGRMIGGGGTGQGGEDAVEAALRWLAFHQQTDGGWSFDFANSCGQCSHSSISTVDRRTAATSLALLAFLGAGYTHQEPSPYRENVDKGLLFLINDPNGGINGAAIQMDTLRMYSYGLGTIALCEAHALSRERDPTVRLGREAQAALWRIEAAQRNSGGWNYRPDQTSRRDFIVYGDNVDVGGDTSIFSWQLMALKSGQLGGLHVSQSVLYAARDFLDLVALDGGRQYHYTPNKVWDPDPERRANSPYTCAAIGLLSRMYLGWKPGDLFLDAGMEQIARWGYTPRAGEVNLYYAYFATLALHHYGGEHWDEWNTGIRELLIQSQFRQGCESGSWYFQDPYCDSGGRLLNTALAVMILETPYRFMPLYRELR
ncbi:MAG: terpene cyclase/mutase family protein [Planctomycetaceae bacterium]|nr:terpene cyclase/mutase family protein [Planctomycetaceae bacterium]